MRTLLSTLLFVCYSCSIFAQNILVQPYLQDAEPTSITIMWESDGGISHTADWGTAPAALNQTVTATSISSQGAHLIHEAKINGLTANSAYYYRVNSDGQSSAVFKFYTPPLKSSEQGFNIVAMSDIQRDGSQPNKFQEIVNDGVLPYIEDQHGADIPAHLGFVMIPGDLVVNGNSYSQWKDHFFDPAHPLFAQVPVYPVLGNHENNSSNYFQYFDLPDNGSPGFDEHWWYKDYSNLRIIGLNSNGGYRIQTQLDWLEDVLTAACNDDDIDFVFAQLHHPFKSELWTPGELDYTGEVIERMENFTENCGKPSIHFFGHTHGYSRGQSRDHEHLWVNVATAGGAIDNWGEFPNADYEEFSKSIDEYGFVVVNVEAGADPKFTLRRISRGDQSMTRDNEEQDVITLKRTDNTPQTPNSVFPVDIEINPDCATLEATAFSDSGDSHQASHWQISSSCGDFSNPVAESWKQHENWYDEVDTQADDLLTDETFSGLPENSAFCWRVRYRDSHLKWSDWSTPASFTTGTSSNLLANPGGEAANLNDWIVAVGVIESLEAGECNGITPRSGSKYLAVGGLCANETAYSEVFQLVNVSGNAADIDAGGVAVSFGGFLSNFNGNDTPTMQLEFLNSSQSSLGSSVVLTTQAGSWTALEAQEVIPVATRFIKVILTGTRNSGTDNDSYFDDLHLRYAATSGTDCSSILPVKLSHISAYCAGETVVLDWEVTAETDISIYRIERSFDGAVWELVGRQTPFNNGRSENQYQFRDEEDLHHRTAYYRLKIVEADQTFRYSPTVSITCEDLSPTINFFPNPIKGNFFKFYLENPQSATTTLEVVNLLGQDVYRREWTLEEGEHQIEIGDIDWANGIYIMTISTPNWQWSGKLIKE